MAEKNKRVETKNSCNSRSLIPVQSKSRSERSIPPNDKQKVERKTFELLQRQHGFEESEEGNDRDGKACTDRKIDENKISHSDNTIHPGIKHSDCQIDENRGRSPDLQSYSLDDNNLTLDEASDSRASNCVEKKSFWRCMSDQKNSDDSSCHSVQMKKTNRTSETKGTADYDMCQGEYETQNDIINNCPNVADTENSEENQSCLPSKEDASHKGINKCPASKGLEKTNSNQSRGSTTKLKFCEDINDCPVRSDAELTGADGSCVASNTTQFPKGEKSKSPFSDMESTRCNEHSRFAGKVEHQSDKLNNCTPSRSTAEIVGTKCTNEFESQDDNFSTLPVSEILEDTEITGRWGSTHKLEPEDDEDVIPNCDETENNGGNISPILKQNCKSHDWNSTVTKDCNDDAIVTNHHEHQDCAINSRPIGDKNESKGSNSGAASTDHYERQDCATKNCPIIDDVDDKDNSNSIVSSATLGSSKHSVNKSIPEEDDAEITTDQVTDTTHVLEPAGGQDSQRIMKTPVKIGHLKKQWRHASHGNPVGKKMSSDDVSSVSTDSGQESWKRRWGGQGSGSSQTSDNVFTSRTYSSVSNLSSFSSLSSGSSQSRDTNTSRMRFELRHRGHGHGSEDMSYLTPLQRREKEVKELRMELSELLRQNADKDEEIANLKHWMEDKKEVLQKEQEAKITDLTIRHNVDMSQLSERLNAQITDLTEKLRSSERDRFEVEEKLCQGQVELEKMDGRYTELKRQMSEKDEQFETYFLDMYVKGQQAAKFEREEELEMLATNRRSRVTVSELTRKLSRTEQELAKWQGLKLGESYSKPDKPETQADVTLSFLRDAFYHFLSDTSGNEVHLRAILKILTYTPEELGKIRQGLEELKRLDRKKVFKS